MKIKIEGMTCGHCVAAVKKVLEAIPEVTSAEVSLEAGEAVVEGGASAETLFAAVREEGYTAEVAA